jgi:hypothetical protein
MLLKVSQYFGAASDGVFFAAKNESTAAGYTMAVTIMDIPADIIHAFVGDPTCQLRYTCTRFWRWIDRHPFVAAPETVSSAWYSVRVPNYQQDCIRDSSNIGRCPTWDRIIETRAPFLLLRSCTRFPAGLLLWDRSILPYLTAAPDCVLYEYILRINGTGSGREKHADVPEGERYVIIGNCARGYLVRQADLPTKLSYCGTIIVYERMKFADLWRHTEPEN